MARLDTLKGSAAALALAMALVAPDVQAEGLPTLDLEVFTDARLSVVSGEQSWFDDWLGKLRYGGNWKGDSQVRLRLAEASIIAKSDLTWNLQAFVHAKYDPEQNKPLDLVEAYLHFKPTPKSNLRYEFRAGLFFPHISRENTGIAWTSPYTITPSAINSWVGEEIRALGLEGKATWKLSPSQRLSATGALFGFNDPAGSLLAFRGWALGDYKVGAFSQLPLPPIPSIGPDSDFLKFQPTWVHPIREVDNRVGFYGALDWQLKGKAKAGVFYYDNRGNPEVIKHSQYGWDTRFWNAYLEVNAPLGIELVAQYLTGNTKMGFYKNGGSFRAVDADYAAGFILASRKVGKHRISVRRDWFDVDDNSFVVEDNNEEVGSAWTAAFNASLGDRDSVIAEILYVDSTRPARWGLWDAPKQTQTQFQLSYRHRF